MSVTTEQIDELLALRCQGTAPVVAWIKDNVSTKLEGAEIVLGCACIVGTYQRSILKGVRALMGVPDDKAFVGPNLSLVRDDPVRLRIAQICSAAANEDTATAVDLIAATANSDDSMFFTAVLTGLIEHAHVASHRIGRMQWETPS